MKSTWKLFDEYDRHDNFVKKYTGTFSSLNSDSNFTELKSKRDLLEEIFGITSQVESE